MYREQIIHIITNSYRVLGTAIKKIVKNFDMEDIHQFRVEYKKLRAFVRMVARQNNAEAKNKISKKLNRCYKISGAIRDLQLQHQQIQEAFKQETAKPAGYLQFLQVEIDKWKPLLINKYSKSTIPESKKKTVAFIPHSFLFAGFNKFKKEKWNTIYGIIESRDFSDDNMHIIRKSLKDLFYNLKLYEKVENRKLSMGFRKGKDASWFDKLLNDLGKFQDKRVAIDLLKSIEIKEPDTSNMEQIERIKKIWIKEKLRMKKLLVKQLVVEIVPLNGMSSDNKLLNIR